MTEEKKTAPNSSVGADAEQSGNYTNPIITDLNYDFNNYADNISRTQIEMLLEMDPTYLKTVSMAELYENVFYSNPPLIDGLLYTETYLFVGAPKLGKSEVWNKPFYGTACISRQHWNIILELSRP